MTRATRLCPLRAAVVAAALIGLLAPLAPRVSSAASPRPAADLEQKLEEEVRAAQARARQIGQATAGSDPGGGGGTAGGGRGICLLGICTEGAAPAVGGGGGEVVRFEPTAGFLTDFARFHLCSQVASLGAQAARERSPERRASILAELQGRQALITPEIQQRYCTRLQQ